MVPEIAADVLHFLSRRDLDTASGVSKYFDALFAECCSVYPLRVVANVELYPCANNFAVAVSFMQDDSEHAFNSMDESVRFASSILRHSYVEILELGDNNERIMTLLPHHWTALINATRSGAIRRLGFNGVDFTALDDDAFLAAIGCRGLKTLEVRECVIRSGFVTDELVRSSVAKGFSELSLWGNKSDSPHRLSDDALMDFFLPLDVAAGRADLVLEGTGVTDMFFTKFIQRLRSGQVRPGSLQFFGAPEQRGLSERIRYLSRYLSGIGSTYRFPSTVDDNNSNKVHFFEDSPCIRLQF